MCCFVYTFCHNKLPNCFERSFWLNFPVHCRSLRRSDDIRTLWLKNQFGVNLFYLLDPWLDPNIGMKFHQISNTAEAYIDSESIWKNILLIVTKHNRLDLVHSEGYCDWLTFCSFCLPISWPAGLFEFFKLIKFVWFACLFYLFSVCLSLQVLCITSSLRGDYKSSIGFSWNLRRLV